MSMIENQVRILKELAELQNISYHKSIINRAADTIEALSEKLETANKELERWHADKINDKIKNPFAWTSTLCCHNCDHKDEYIEELEAADMERSAEDKNSWQPISEYNREKYDWVLIKYFDGEEECVPQVAELRPDGKWHVSTDFDGDVAIPPWFDVRYFFDMQQLDNHEP